MAVVPARAITTPVSPIACGDVQSSLRGSVATVEPANVSSVHEVEWRISASGLMIVAQILTDQVADDPSQVAPLLDQIDGQDCPGDGRWCV